MVNDAATICCKAREQNTKPRPAVAHHDALNRYGFMKHILRVVRCWLIVGCLTSTAEGAWPSWPFDKDEQPGKPDKVVAFWTDTVLTQANRPATRGFGGRLMFFEGKKEKPIKVDGTLVVYAFDESDRDQNNAKPDRKYVFLPDQLPAHYSKSKIGHSYSVWIPWDAVGGMQKEITLIARFEPKEGSAVVGEQCRQLLPGALPQQAASVPNPPAAALASPIASIPVNTTAWRSPIGGNAPMPVSGAVQPTSYEAPATVNSALIADSASAAARRMTTATIPLPAGMAMRQLSAAGTTFQPASPWQPPPPWQPDSPQVTDQPSYPSTSTPAAQPTLSNPLSLPPDHFAPGQSRVPGQSFDRLARDRAAWQPSLAKLPSVPESQPGPATPSTIPANWPNAGQAFR